MPGAPMCPLCYKRMRIVDTKKGSFYVCMDTDCMVSINTKDPAIDRWAKIQDAPKDAGSDTPTCPRCGTIMRIFFRIWDGYIKAQCPKCRKEGKIVQVQKGKVEHLDPRWSE